MKQEELKKWKQAGKIGAEVRKYAKTLIKKDADMLEVAEKVEEKIKSFKATSAFPINISCNEIAAHCSPSYNDELKINGLVKLDLGISIDGFISDTAISIDLTDDKKYTELIKASEEALKNAIKIIKPGVTLGEIGKVIQETISEFGFAPIKNLCGHELKQYLLHAGTTIPNHNNESKETLKEGQILAIEPFATTGEGIVQDGKLSGIYHLIDKRPVRDQKAREILDYIEENYQTLPFSARWLVKKFGPRALFSLRALEQNESLHHFKQLVEKTKHPVSQSEHTILVTKDGCEVLTE